MKRASPSRRKKRPRSPSQEELPDLLRLPVELTFHVISYLDLPSKGRLASVCRTFRSLMYSDVVWQPEIDRRWNRQEAERFNPTVFGCTSNAKFRFRELETQSRPYRPLAADLFARLADLDSLSWADCACLNGPEVQAQVVITTNAAGRSTVVGLRGSALIEAPADVVANAVLSGLLSSRVRKYVEEGVDVVEVDSETLGRLTLLRSYRWEGESFVLCETSQFPPGLKAVDGSDIVGGVVQKCSLGSALRAALGCPVGGEEVLPCGFVIRPEVAGISCVVTRYFMLDLKTKPKGCIIKRWAGWNTGLMCSLKKHCEDQQRELVVQRSKPSDPGAPAVDPCSLSALSSVVRSWFS